jgi:proline-specific peptidase
MSAPVPFKEGHAPFTLPPHPTPNPSHPPETTTYHRVYGTLPAPAGTHPLIVLHGGPGACHNYMTPLADLTAAHGIPVILYDQIGNGLSTHLPQLAGATAFWTEALFLAELESLLAHLGIAEYDVLGHSWGGMIAATFAARRPRGLRRLVIADSPADMRLWVTAQNRLRGMLPQGVQDTLARCEGEGRTESEEYEGACMEFYKRFLCTLEEWPKDLDDSMEWLVKKDPTVYLTV